MANTVENPDGPFVAWATGATGTAVADYVEDGPENAKRAASVEGVLADACERRSGQQGAAVTMIERGL